MDGARLVGERIRAEVARASTTVADGVISATCSIGIASYPGVGITTHQDLIQRADDALYKAKKNGRNCVVTGHDLTPKSA
jgi:diguanylate cyclase (GGDEF)-like protein